MKLKTSELFCASPASTAICTTMNHHAMVRRSSTTSTPRPINHRHHNYYNNHYQFDFEDKPKFKVPPIPCTSNQHIDPKPYTSYSLQKPRKSTGSFPGKGLDFPGRRKTSVGMVEMNNRSRNINGSSSTYCSSYNSSSSSSSRYLLNNPVFVADVKDSAGGCDAGALVVSEQVWPEEYDDDDGDVPVVKKSLSARRWQGGESPAVGGSRSSAVEATGVKSLRSRSCNQVVELRVSIHCKGCEGKVRKHISRMEGVKSFHIDLESKKVTVVGDVTPLSVLESISKVKNAQLWPSLPPSSSSSSVIAIGY